MVDDLGPAPAGYAAECPSTGVLSLSVDDIRTGAGQDTPVSATLTNHADEPVTDVDVKLTGPIGFTLEPTSPTAAATLAPGESLKATYKLRFPADAKPGSYHVSGEAGATFKKQRVMALSDSKVTFNCRPDVRCEAEDAVLRGTTTESLARGQSGDGYVNYPSGNGDSIEWTVDAEQAGDYTVAVHYALLSGDRPLTLTVNGTDVGTQSWPLTGSWSTWSDRTFQLPLKAGLNTIRLTSAKDDGPNIDYLTATSAGSGG